MEAYIAHSSEDGRLQTAKEHSENTARLSKMFAERFGSGEYAYYIGLLHDLGKYTDGFQRRIEGDPRKVCHSLAGAVEFYYADSERNSKFRGALCIAGHHAGLPNLADKETGSLTGGSLIARLRDRGSCETPDPVWKSELKADRKILASLPDPSFSGSKNRKAAKALWTHFLYSCLTDADFLDTESFMKGEPIRYPLSFDPESLIARADAYAEKRGWLSPSPAGSLNRKRSEILRRCISCGESSRPGLFTLTVPTGGGKTFASLMFALRHARANGMSRIVYVVPYISIIEQNAQVFRDILGEECVLEHHSCHSYDTESSEGNPAGVLRMAKATENWDAPVIVTTAVQFFESLFSDRPGRSRKVHSLAGSVIVFDEAQMLPVPYLEPCVFAIAELAQNYGATAVLCTATQPALGSVFERFLRDFRIQEICPKELSDDRAFSRVTFERIREVQGWESIAGIMAQESQALCIVNSRKKAGDLFRELSAICPQDSVFHLSTLMAPVHRQKAIAEIRRRTESGLPCLAVSTSLIEAGVDVDFPRVLRELAGLDSILQAAGRCNREGRRKASDSRVTVFESLDTSGSFLFRLPVAVCRRILRELGDSLDRLPDSDTVEKYFGRLLDIRSLGTGSRENPLDERGILDMLASSRHRDAGRAFRIIDAQCTVYIPYGREGKELCRQWLDGHRNRRLLRRLSRYGVSLYRSEYRRLLNAGAIDTGAESQEGEEEKQGVLRDLSLYSETLGLMVRQEAESLFV